MSRMLQITHVSMSVGGSTHEHIEDVWVVDENPPFKAGWWKVEDVLREIERGARFVVGDGHERVDVQVGRSSTGHEYIQTVADGRWTNNLLVLPHERRVA